MKLNLKCQKCGSDKVSVTSDAENPTPMYKCNICGYKHNIFPNLGNDGKGDDE